MVGFTYAGTYSGGPDITASSIRDLMVYDSGAGPRLYILAADGGSISVYDPENGMALLGEVYFPESTTAGNTSQLELSMIGGSPALLVQGGPGTGLLRYPIETDGLLGQVDTIAAPAEGFATTELVTVGGNEILFSASATQSGVSCWTQDGTSQMQLADQIGLGSVDQGNDIPAMAQITRGSDVYVFVASTSLNSLTAMRVNPDGTALMSGQITSGDDFWIDTPTALATAEIAGQDFVLMAASGTSSIVVARLEDDGSLTVVDQINDTQDTRFENLTVMETVEVDGHVFVIAGGADDGLSLFRLTPEGRLLHQQSIADDTQMALTDVISLSVSVVNGEIVIFAAGEGATEVTYLQVDPGNLGIVQRGGAGDDLINGSGGDDMLSGGAGDDTLSGGGGDDILIDGSGTDSMRGGEGADVFVFGQDGQMDRVLDFEAGIDRLDLSGIGRVYSLDALTFEPTSDGIRIIFQDEVIELVSADGQPLDAADFTQAGLFDLWHVVNDAPQVYEQPFLTLLGGNGNDMLVGGSENNLIIGENQVASLDTVSGQIVRIYQAVLGRDPELGGLNYWMDVLTGGASLSSISAGFMSSEEFQTQYGATASTDFVVLLYNNVLGRNPNPDGLEYWTGLLDSGAYSREEVVVGFSESLEFRNDMAGDILDFSWAGMKAIWTSAVFGLFRATLDRQPQYGGLDAWTTILSEGTDLADVASGFVNSAEFQAIHGSTTNEEFINLLYQNILGRAPEQSGLDAWLSYLANGTMTREEIVVGFSQSLEFQTSIAEDLTAFMRDLGANDRLVGGGGENDLFGGWRADTFVFNASQTATDTVHGLEAWDWIELQQSNFLNATEVLGALTETPDGVILVDGDTTILFADTHISDFSEDMFVFI